MEHIQKIGTLFEKTGNVAVQNYLDACWNHRAKIYNNPKYGKSIRQTLRPLLLQEQNYYCCYCMRKLYLTDTDSHLGNVTLEHIVPNKITQKEWAQDKAQYVQFPNLTSTYINVCCGGELPAAQINVKISGTPYPHFISYYNLVASCDGRTIELGTLKEHNCCNNKRDRDFVLPMYLDYQMANDMGYDKGGKLDFDDTKYQDTWFQILNLQHDNIRLIRKLWYKISQSSYTVQDIDDSITNLPKRQDIIDDIDNENEIASWATNSTCWILLSEYSWFYTYYSRKYKHP